jgi:hypothetical protein
LIWVAVMPVFKRRLGAIKLADFSRESGRLYELAVLLLSKAATS